MIRRTPLHRLPFPSAFRKPLRTTLLAVATLALAAGGYAQSTQQSQNAAAAAPDEPYHGTVVEQVVAQVNDQIISTSDYNRAEQELEQQASQQNWSQDKLEDARRNLLRDLIDNQLLLSKGKQLGITGEAETIRELDQIRKQNHLDSMEALEDAVAKQGLNFADFKASIQNRVITSQVIREEVGRRINITQAEERAYYDAHKSDFMTPESVKLSEILIPTADPDNTAEVDAAQKKADAIEAQLKSGGNFADLAKADSGGTTAAQGGLLGEYTRGQLAKVLEDDTFSLDPGQYTEPIRTKQGFIILKVDAHTKASLEPFDTAENQVEEAVGMQKMQPALRSYLSELRDEAYIEVRPGYIDSAATKNEVHPLYSAYQPPHAKKKKKKTVVRYGEEHEGRRTRTNFGVSHPTETAAVPSNVPSLADVANGTAPAAAQPEQPELTKKEKKEEARSQKPGKREKVRYGQAPRESLPSASHDVDASQAQAANPGQPQGNNTAEADDSEATAKPKKVRYSSLAFQSRAEKKKRKAAEARAKLYPYENKPETAQEKADQAQQDQPLGLAGDTTKKKKKPKPAEKTRYSSQAYDKTPAAKTPPPSSDPGPNTPAAPQITPDATPPPSTQPPQN
jgi:peptidyl-prolyl cis-trans isomerase SurA